MHLSYIVTQIIKFSTHVLIFRNLFINVYQDSRACNFSIEVEKLNFAWSGVPWPQTTQHTQRRIKRGCPT